MVRRKRGTNLLLHYFRDGRVVRMRDAGEEVVFNLEHETQI